MKKKMKACFFNFRYAKGHTRLDISFIETLSELCDVVCISPPSWYTIYSKNIIIREVAGVIKYISKFPRLQTFYLELSNIKKAIYIINKEVFDIIIIGQSDVLAFPFYMLMCGKHNIKRTVVIHHSDLDTTDSRSLLNKLRRRIFCLYKNRIVNCVLEPFMKESLVKDYNISADHIVCWRHSLPVYQNKVKTGYDCVGISHSNDESVIMELIRREDAKNVFKNNNLHVLFRSKKTKYDNGYLKVKPASERLDDEEYKELFETAKVVFLPLPEHFKNRVSGAVYDAFAAEKPIIASDVPFIRYCKKTYGNICEIYNPETFIEEIKYLSSKENNQTKSFNHFFDDHNKACLLSNIQDTINLIVGIENEKMGYK